MLNEEELVEALRDNGINVTVWDGTKNMNQAASMFGDAAVVFGPHGAGLANMVPFVHVFYLLLARTVR